MVGGTGLYLDAILRGYQLSPVPRDQDFRDLAESMTSEDLQAELDRLRSEQHNTTDQKDRQRLIRAIEIARAEQDRSESQESPPLPEITPLVLGIHFPRSVLRDRITERLKYRLDHGLIEEVVRLREQGVAWETLDFYGLEYRLIALHVRGELNRNDMFQKLNSAIHKFAKRQETWFRKIEKSGVHINWLNGTDHLIGKAQAIVESGTDSLF